MSNMSPRPGAGGVRVTLSVLLAACLLLAATGRPGGAAWSKPAQKAAPLKIGEKNVLFVGQTIPIVLGRVNKPGTNRELTEDEVEFVSSDPSVLMVTGRTMTALSASAEPVRLSVFERPRAARARRARTPMLDYLIEVVERAPTNEIKTSAASVDLLPGRYVRLGAQPTDDGGNAVPAAKVEWKFKDPDADSYAELLPGANNTVAVLAKNGATFDAAPTRLLLAAAQGGKEAVVVVNLKKADGNSGKEGGDGAEGKTHAVRGEVLGGSGAVDGVTVTLSGGDDAFARTVTTGTDGKFDFDGIKAPKNGKGYTLTPSKPGYNFSPTNLPVGDLASDRQVNFVASPVPAPDPVTKFVDAKLDVLDFRTASNLFGSVTNKQYYIAKLQFFNKLYDLKNGSFVGDSIVVYSDSIKVPVNYEVRYIGSRKDALQERREWHPLEVELVTGPDVSQKLQWGEWAKNKKDVWAALGKEPAVRDGSVSPDKDAAGALIDPNCTQTPDYRSPYTFDQMMSTVDRRDAREWRTRLVTLGQSASTLTSFVTSFIVPTGTNDTPVILEKFNSLLMPSFKEHFPSTKEQQRQNLTREIIKPVETIPFKQDIVRVVFLPKEEWKSKDYAVRISHICEQQPIKVEAVVAKAGDQLPIHTLSGRVEFEGGSTPVEGAKVELSGVFTTPRSTFTTRNGEYAFQNLEPGSYTLLARDPKGCNITSRPVQVEVKAGRDAGETLKLPSSQGIRGRVLKDAAQPLAKATVQLQKDGQTVLEAPTDAEGRYVFTCVLKGNYTLVVKTTEKINFKPVAINDLSGDRTLDDIKPEADAVELDE